MAESSNRRGWMLGLGVALLLVGLIGAGAIWYGGGQRLDDNVAAFARAPSGCSTTLDFERTGEFNVFVETTGQLDDLPGDCAQRRSYEREGFPQVDVVIIDGDGQMIELAADPGVDYDTGTFAGSSVGTVTVDVAGDYVLAVPADGAPFAIAVGGDPNDGVAVTRWGALALGLAGVIGGGALLVVGSRQTPDVDDESPWQPAEPDWPTSPPGFPAPSPTTGAAAPAGTPPLPGPPGLAPGMPTLPPRPADGDEPPSRTPTDTPPSAWGPPSAGGA